MSNDGRRVERRPRPRLRRHMLLPDLTDSGGTTRHLAVGAGKDGNIYVVNRDSMGKFNAGSNNNLAAAAAGRPAAPAASGRRRPTSTAACTTARRRHAARRSRSAHAKLVSDAVSQSARVFGYPGTSPVDLRPTAPPTASSGRTRTPTRRCCTPTTPATSRHELYNSSQAAGSRDQFGARQQVHHADDRRRQGVRRHHQRRGGVRPAELSRAAGRGQRRQGAGRARILARTP